MCYLLHIFLPAQITDIGDLESGSSVIIFYILSTTDMTSDPTPLLADVVATAISASNVQEIDEYPVSDQPSIIETSFPCYFLFVPDHHTGNARHYHTHFYHKLRPCSHQPPTGASGGRSGRGHHPVAAAAAASRMCGSHLL